METPENVDLRCSCACETITNKVDHARKPLGTFGGEKKDERTFTPCRASTPVSRACTILNPAVDT